MIKLNNISIIIVGSNSIHTIRYLKAISPYFNQIILITNNDSNLDLPENVISYSVNFKLFNIKARYTISNIIKKYYQTSIVVHIHQANSYAMHTIMAIKLTKLPLKAILTTWGSDILLLPYKNKLFYKFAKYYLANVDIVTSDSLYLSYSIRQIQPKTTQIQTINFGVQNLPNLIDINKKQDIILSNRIHKKLYNIDKIIHNYAIFIAKNPIYANYKLIIAGDGVESAKLRDLAQKYNLANMIEFTGMLKYDDLIELYTKAKLFISIPSSDSTSSSLLEAMSYGCYPIVSNLPANNEWVINQYNGQICENINTLDKVIKQALDLISNNDEYKKLALFNNNLINLKASPNQNIIKFLELYK